MILLIRHQQHGQILHMLADQEHSSDLSTAHCVSGRGEDIRNMRRERADCNGELLGDKWAGIQASFIPLFWIHLLWKKAEC